ncbi:hypothetical protein LCGC14_2765770 [marine sediment metagenome]|uniref:Magnetochrome domain-containing protein n=1 Tax=marine sediment metagenome TaxID=412755 RepID=A0A0F8ZJF9_9ZZZZ|nr:PDZ domain-containing protein [Candidatus Scalindua sediminis]HDY67707.1 PDZ domain-containing protein [Candidatus Scalindua sp.]
MKQYRPELAIIAVGFLGLIILVFLSLVSFQFGGDFPDRWDQKIDTGKQQWNRQWDREQKNFGQHTAFQQPSQRQFYLNKLENQQAKLNKKLIKKLQLTEAHWQGMELMEFTPEIKQKLQYPPKLKGLLIDEVTLNSLASGLRGGDILVFMNGKAVRHLKQFHENTKRVRNDKKAKLEVWRQGRIMKFKIRALDFLGVAQVETAPMVAAGAISPHQYRGPCTICHLIGTGAHIAPDPDGIILPPPPIAKNAKLTHRDYGKCEACHVIK